MVYGVHMIIIIIMRDIWNVEYVWYILFVCLECIEHIYKILYIYIDECDLGQTIHIHTQQHHQKQIIDYAWMRII